MPRSFSRSHKRLACGQLAHKRAASRRRAILIVPLDELVNAAAQQHHCEQAAQPDAEDMEGHEEQSISLGMDSSPIPLGVQVSSRLYGNSVNMGISQQRQGRS